MRTAISNMTPPNLPRVLVSILNWNGVAKTLVCLDSLQRELMDVPANVTVLVIDNGSRSDDAERLAREVASRPVVLKCLPKNLGFTGGHNIAIETAIREDYDFIWLLNNDAKVEPGTLGKLIEELQANERCGVASPVLRDIHDGHIARCVNTHDWHKRKTRLILDMEQARRFQEEHPQEVWVDGTAVLFRVQALRETGPLDDRLFAYYDDNDIGVRLARRGWTSRCVFDATVYHENRAELEEFPLYLIYLLQRNEMLFLHTNTPPAHRRLLWLKLVDKAMYDATRYAEYGRPTYRDAALLGMYDFLSGSFGPPAHDRKVPLFLRAACWVSLHAYNLKNARSRRAARQALAPAQ